MRCYASVDRIEGKYAVCEVEIYLLEESRRNGVEQTETVMSDIPLQEIPVDIGEVKEGDILIVEYDEKDVTAIYCKDEEEKVRRLKLLKELMGW